MRARQALRAAALALLLVVLAPAASALPVAPATVCSRGVLDVPVIAVNACVTASCGAVSADPTAPPCRATPQVTNLLCPIRLGGPVCLF